MSAPRRAPRTASRGLSRRHVLVASAAFAAGLAGRSGRGAASGVLAGAGLTELRTYSGWRRSWDIIVPLIAGEGFPRTFLLYDRAAGEASLQAVDEFGGVRELLSYPGWRRSWDVIVPSGFPRVLGTTGLIAYDRAAGLTSVQQIDLAGRHRELASYPAWRTTWSIFAPFGQDRLLVYDRAAGYATFYDIDTGGALRELRSYNDWRKSWDIITAGSFLTDALPPADLLYYDRTAGQAAAYAVDQAGEISQFSTFNGWRRTWTGIWGGRFRFQGFSGSAVANLLLYDRDARELEFVDIGPGNAIVSILLTAAPGGKAWTHVTPLGPDLILLYDRATGAAGFYATNRLPAQTPTPAPTRTPVPTPTPAVPETARVTVRLEQGKDNRWYIYEGKSSNPAIPGSRKAYIAGVRNTADKRISLIHRDRDGARIGPVFLKAGEKSDAFNGMGIGGDWEARVTGGKSEAPPRVTLEVIYELR